MDKTLLKQKIDEWNNACDFFIRSDVRALLAKEEIEAIVFLQNFWKEKEYNKVECEKRINTLKEKDKIHSPHREIIEKSKIFRGIATTIYTKDASTYDEFRRALGWKQEIKTTPTPIPISSHNQDHAMMMLNVEKWSKAIQFLKSENIIPQLDIQELTAIERLADMWRRPFYQTSMKEDADEMIKVLIASHKLHSANREIIEHSKNICAVARKIYDNQDAFLKFKQLITQYYREQKPPKKDFKQENKHIPQKEPIKHDKKLIITDVVFANSTYEGDIIGYFGRQLYSDTQYIMPRITVGSDFYGKEEIEVVLSYSNGAGAQYTNDIEFKGKGTYLLLGWGSRNGDSYINCSYVQYVIKCKGEVLWQGRVDIVNVSSNHDEDEQNISRWGHFKSKIENIRDWIDDKLEDPESISTPISRIIAVIGIIAVIITWINDGFWTALLTAVIGVVVVGLLTFVANVATRLILWVLRILFANAWVVIIAFVFFILPNILSIIIALFSLIGSNDTLVEESAYIDSSATYYSNKKGVEVRNAPSESAIQIGSLQYNEEVEVYEIDENYARIDYLGGEAWVNSEFLSMSEGEQFLIENAKRSNIIVMPSGLQYEIVESGQGNSPSENSKVRCNYTCTLHDGTLIDQTHETPVKLSVNKLVDGWQEAMLMMKEGDHWKIYVPARLAFGGNGNSYVEPHATLVIDMTLVDVL